MSYNPRSPVSRLSEELISIIATYLSIQDLDSISRTCSLWRYILQNKSLWIDIISQHSQELAFRTKFLTQVKEEPWQKLRDIAKSLAGTPRPFGVSYPSIHTPPSAASSRPCHKVLNTPEGAWTEQVLLLPGGRWLLGFCATAIYIWDIVSSPNDPIYRVLFSSLSSGTLSEPLIVDTAPQTQSEPDDKDLSVSGAALHICADGERVLIAVLFQKRIQHEPLLCTSHIQVISLRMGPRPFEAQCLHKINVPAKKRITEMCLDDQHIFFCGYFSNIFVVRFPCPSAPNGIFTELAIPAGVHSSDPMWMKLSGPYLFLRKPRSVVILKVPPVSFNPSRSHSGDGRPKYNSQRLNSAKRKGHFPIAYQIFPHLKDHSPGISRQINLADGSMAPIRMLFKKYVWTLTPCPANTPSAPQDLAVDPDELSESRLFDCSSREIIPAGPDALWKSEHGKWSFGVCGHSGLSGVAVMGDDLGDGPRVNVVRGWGTRHSGEVVARMLYRSAEPGTDGTVTAPSSTSGPETLLPNGQIEPFTFTYDDLAYHSIAVATRSGKIIVARFD